MAGSLGGNVLGQAQTNNALSQPQAGTASTSSWATPATTTAAQPKPPGSSMYMGSAAPKGQDFGQGQMIGTDTLNQTGGFQTEFGASDPIQKTVDNNGVPVTSVGQGEMYQKQMQDAYYNQAASRLNPQWQEQQEGLETQLANMGLSRGSQAWTAELDRLGRMKNDAYGSAMNQAIMNSGQEAQRMQGMELASGNFANAAAGQQFGQNLAQGQFANQAQNQGYQQELGRGQFANAGLTAQQGAAQGWGQQATQRYGSDQSRAGQEHAAASNAAGMSAAASASAAASMANAQLNASLQARQIANAEQQQAYMNNRQATFDPLIYQQQMTQGMYPNAAYQGGSLGAGAAAYPGQSDQSGYASQINQGYSQGYGNLAGVTGTLGGMGANYLNQPPASSYVGYNTIPMQPGGGY